MDSSTPVLQNVLVGKTREVYSALTVKQYSDNSVMCRAILKTYELVPEAYRQKSRNL